MLTITLHDDVTGDMIKINFSPTDKSAPNGEGIHVAEVECVTDMEEIKKSASPLFKTGFFKLMHSFGLAKKEAK